MKCVQDYNFVPVGDIDIGDCFYMENDGCLYMRISDPHPSNTMAQIVNLKTGVLHEIKLDSRCTSSIKAYIRYSLVSNLQ